MRTALIVVLALGAITGIAAAADLGPFRSFEDRLKAAVTSPACSDVAENRHGFHGEPYATLRRESSSVRAAYCEMLGPTITWYRYDTQRSFRIARAGLRNAKGEDVCVATDRREIIVAYDARGFAELCRERGGTVRRRPSAARQD